MKWLGYANRTDEVRKIKQFLEVQPEGQRSRGTPLMTHQSYAESLGQVRGKNLPEVKSMCMDRNRWR